MFVSSSIRASGSAAWNLAQVARGGIDVYMEMGIHAWDMAAGEVIVKEAGGYVLDPSGNQCHGLMFYYIMYTSMILIIILYCYVQVMPFV